MNTLTQINAPFNGAELLIVECNNQPYTPMKPIVEGMGLAWQAQYDKLKQRFASTIMEIMTVANDGKERLMICLPLRKLFGWLMTISPNKVKPELRDRVIMYQNECDDVLWDYWMKGQAINQRHTITAEQQDALHAIVARRAGGNRKIRAEMWSRHNRHFKIAKYSQLLDIHFDDAVHYLEEMELHAKAELDSIKQLDDFLKNIASRYPALKNPIAHEIAEKIEEKMQFQDTSARLVYWVVSEAGKVIVQPMSTHHAPVDIVRLSDDFSKMHDYLTGSGILERARHLSKLELRTLP
ncbi:hypothetical protein F959_01642 [Acinetobacter venetianus RAG-1 = CIP 110063]|uniref:Antirepressor protein ant N-terminal domain-containing protein n=1 Tax=Acinetobacter venetianus (strain ATCC 31012 / DSM 23050 / BCRC 14357 / CCUG 45561 / CIP 110063 / KCTC 2702 / LMG 19082 / RAG-1) TaxID=1191460 RepID=N8ZZ72_ACIVR|nr:phage antirepressor N-terminal domain-containing protein [Acinetobacter venetianus]ENV36835.1 hypothetical protein F959_01642 [Acinetobacter venetianus RAG-1 = CIP 110063]